RRLLVASGTTVRHADARERGHLVVGLEVLLDAHCEPHRRIEHVRRERDEVSTDTREAARLRRAGGLHDELRHVQAAGRLEVAVLRVTAIAEPVPVEIGLIRIRNGRAVVLAVDDAVAVRVEGAGPRRADAGEARARTAARGWRAAHRAVGRELT